MNEKTMAEVPEEAVEAAVRAIVSSLPNNAEFETHRTWATGYARAALEAAAPFIAAKVLEDAADELYLPGTAATGYYSSGDHAGYQEAESHAESWLRDRAAAVRGEG